MAFSVQTTRRGKRMRNIAYGCQTYPWKMNQKRYAGDLPHMAQVASQAGFTGLEAEIGMLGTYFDEPARAKDVLDAYRLDLAAIVLHQPWAGPGETAEEAALSEQAVGFVSFFPGAKLIVSHHAVPGDRPDDYAELKRRRENLLFCMAAVANRAAGKGIVTAFHPNSSVHSLFRTERDYEVLFGMLSKGGVGYAPDIGHIVNGGMDALETLCVSRQLVRHVHFKDRTMHGEWAVMGEGDVDYPSIIRCLEDIEYNGWIIVEDESPEARADSDAVVRRDGAYIQACQKAKTGQERKEG
jgi:inosose dehydratase